MGRQHTCNLGGPVLGALRSLARGGITNDLVQQSTMQYYNLLVAANYKIILQ